ncbi:MAG: hypothetical protein HY057_06160 [Rhodospirillales bacterium]|nr:hypothetical protein [Rhodospirillales bacterium]
MRARHKRKYIGEPSLDEMLDDPVVQAMMARDGVKREALVALIAAARTRLGLVTECGCAE